MKIGDTLKFKKLKWTIVSSYVYFPSGKIIYRYRVYRKFFGCWLSCTKQKYEIGEKRWNFLKQQLKLDKNYHYNMHLWSGAERKKS